MSRIRFGFILIAGLTGFMTSSCAPFGFQSLNYDEDSEFYQADPGDYYAIVIDPSWPWASSIIWSPTGNVIAFTAEEREDETVTFIRTVNLDTGEILSLFDENDSAGSVFTQTWSPDGKQLLYSKDIVHFEEFVIVSSGEIWTSDTHGIKPDTLLTVGKRAAWSPTGEIAIMRTIGYEDPISIFIIDPATNVERLVFVQHGFRFTGFSWSPDSKKLVFTLAEDTEAPYGGYIYVLDVETEEAIQITTYRIYLHPTWSPAADIIAYTKHSERYRFVNELHLMKSDGSCDVQVTPDGVGVGSLTWSPDGTQIAFTNRGGVYLIDLADVFGEAFFSEDFPCNVAE